MKNFSPERILLKHSVRCAFRSHSCDFNFTYKLKMERHTKSSMAYLLNYLRQIYIRQENNFSQVFKEIETINVSIQNNHSMKPDEVQNDKDTSDKTVNVNKNEPVVIVKPKRKQKSDETKAAMTTKFPNPQTVNIRGVNNLPNGGIAINCKSAAESRKLQEEASKQLGDDYTVIIPEIRRPKIVVMGMNEKLSTEEITDFIKEQNGELTDCNMKVVSIFENKGRKNFGAIIEVDSEQFDISE